MTVISRLQSDRQKRRNAAMNDMTFMSAQPTNAEDNETYKIYARVQAERKDRAESEEANRKIEMQKFGDQSPQKSSLTQMIQQKEFSSPRSDDQEQDSG